MVYVLNWPFEDIICFCCNPYQYCPNCSNTNNCRTVLFSDKSIGKIPARIESHDANFARPFAASIACVLGSCECLLTCVPHFLVGELYLHDTLSCRILEVGRQLCSAQNAVIQSNQTLSSAGIVAMKSVKRTQHQRIDQKKSPHGAKVYLCFGLLYTRG